MKNCKKLANYLTFPVTAWNKYNGFLGIMAVVNDTLTLASKSTTVGEHVDLFKEVFFESVPSVIQSRLQETLTKFNCSAVFEVVHPEDPHIIDYADGKRLYLLDFIPNTLMLRKNNLDVEFSKTVKEYFTKFAEVQQYLNSEGALQFKTAYKVCNNWKEVVQTMKDADTMQTEGFVYEDSEGFLFKYKGMFYNVWKFRRSLVNKYLKDPLTRFPFQICRTDSDVRFMTWVISQPIQDVQSSDIVQLRKQYFLATEK